VKRALLVSFLVATILCWIAAIPAFASDDSECGQAADMTGASAHCVKSGSETNEYIAAHSDHTYSIRPACEVSGTAICADPATCNIEGHDGFLYNVYEDANPDPLDWQACLTKQEAKHLGGVTPGMVQHAFQRLAWPASELVVQPPDGKTLVNFDTNFYTTNTRPTTQTVTLIGQPVTIEATPTQYTWHFGGEAGDLTTSDPGAAYPDLRITYRYTRIGAVQPSVDTTYAGRYRVGNGNWQTIPDTLTVPGAAVDLQVVSATPHLVGY
jgi:hypothetical protein